MRYQIFTLRTLHYNIDAVVVSGASESSVDLLPNPTLKGSWTKDLPTDDGQESDQIFAFDGKTTAIEVTSSSKLKFVLGSSFTLSTWMKHGSDDEKDFTKHGVKEHVLCHSDGDGDALYCFVCLQLLLMSLLL